MSRSIFVAGCFVAENLYFGSFFVGVCRQTAVYEEMADNFVFGLLHLQIHFFLCAFMSDYTSLIPEK